MFMGTMLVGDSGPDGASLPTMVRIIRAVLKASGRQEED